MYIATTILDHFQIINAYLHNEVIVAKEIWLQTREKVYSTLNREELVKRVMMTTPHGFCSLDKEPELKKTRDQYADVNYIKTEIYAFCSVKDGSDRIFGHDMCREIESIQPKYDEFVESWNKIKDQIIFAQDDTKSMIEAYISNYPQEKS